MRRFAAGVGGGSRRRAAARDDRGAALLEFALVGAPLLFILFAIIEIGLIFAGNVNLDNAVLSVARQVRLGAMVLPGMAATTSSGTQTDLADFKKKVCQNMVMVTNATCLSQLQVDVRVLSSFGSSPPNPISGTNFSSSSFCFYSGVPGNIVSIRAYLLWPVATPVLLPTLTNITSISGSSGSSTGSFFVLMADEAFVNEPNSAGTNTNAGC